MKSAKDYKRKEKIKNPKSKKLAIRKIEANLKEKAQVLEERTNMMLTNIFKKESIDIKNLIIAIKPLIKMIQLF